MKRSSLARQNAGFTLVELMLVTVMSSLSLSLVFYFLAQNSRLFRVQEDYAQMQYSLQFAADRIENDLQRSAYMIPPVPLAKDQRYCTVPLTNDTGEAIIQPGSPVSGLIGVNFQNATDTFQDVGPGGYQMAVSSDRLDIFGNLTANQEFLADVVSPTVLRIYYDSTVIPDQATFRQIFLSPNQFYRVLGMGGKIQIVQVDKLRGVFGPTFSEVDLHTGRGFDLNLSPNCGVSVTGTVRIAPLLKIGYRLLSFPVAAAAIPAVTALAPGTEANPRSLFDWRLVRVAYSAVCQNNTPPRCNWEIMDRALLSNPATPPATPHPPLVLANNVVDLQFFFSFRNPDATNSGLYLFHPRSSLAGAKALIQEDNAITFPPLLNAFAGVAIWPASTLERLSLIRSVFFRLSIRTEEDDPNFAHIARTAFPAGQPTPPILSFNKRILDPGASKVRSVVRHVQLLNFSN